MSDDGVILSEKKKALLAYKESLLDQINIYDTKIEEVRQSQNQVFHDEEDSSDSDCGLPVPTAIGPSMAQLRAQEDLLRVRLQATVELTSLQVVESEVNVVVEAPEILNGNAPTEDGLWREVAAECRVDLIPFTITFHVHQPSRRFSAPSYHNLRVSPVKRQHEVELAGSVLRDVRTPSDAVQIIRCYASAHRSRRTTLARLAEKYADNLFMEALPEGGYQLKCANMEMSWSLQNKWSPIAPFYHRIKFDVDYIDDEQIKLIKQAHKRIIDPSADTKDRTYYLAAIIDICLEMAGAASNIEESDTDTEKLNKTRTTLDQEPEMPTIRRNEDAETPAVANSEVTPFSKDGQVMAPPKGPPKKAKGKENLTKASEDRKSMKRMLEKGDARNQGVNVKKARSAEGSSVDKVEGGKEAVDKAEKVVADKVRTDKVMVGKGKVDKVIVAKSKADKVVAQKNVADKLIAEKGKVDKVMVEKGKLDKVMVEKGKADKVLVAKSIADKVVAEKTVAGKLMAEKGKVDQVMGEKRKAVKVLVEKSKADKVVAEKIGADKVMTEKVKAAKQMAEKGKTDKAVVEKGKADKVVVDKAVVDVGKKTISTENVKNVEVKNIIGKAKNLDKVATKRPTLPLAEVNAKKLKPNKMTTDKEKNNLLSKDVASDKIKKITNKNERTEKQTDKIISGNVAAFRVSDKIKDIAKKDDLVKDKNSNTDKGKIMKSNKVVPSSKEENKAKTENNAKSKESNKIDKEQVIKINKENVKTKIPMKVSQNVHRKMQLNNVDVKKPINNKPLKSKIPHVVNKLTKVTHKQNMFPKS